jgi:GntR family transcriptional regulator
MPHIALQVGPITLYAQLASILRDRIVTGVWKTGDEIPTLEDLVEEFSVARVTVRQAVQILIDDGLLSSQRGRRTFVTYESPAHNANPLFSSTGSIDNESTNYSINIFARQEFNELPKQYAEFGISMGKYTRIRKVDSENGTPYAVSDGYVATSVFRRFPPRAELKMKLSRLVRDYSRPAVVQALERIAVAAANYEEADHLKVPMGSPVARVTRAFLTGDGQLVYVAVFTYRGDRFAIERDITHALVNTPGSVTDVTSRRRTARPAPAAASRAKHVASQA